MCVKGRPAHVGKLYNFPDGYIVKMLFRKQADKRIKYRLSRFSLSSVHVLTVHFIKFVRYGISINYRTVLFLGFYAILLSNKLFYTKLIIR